MGTNGPSNDVLETLKVSEGFRGKPYKDTVGVWTVGYGFNLEALSMPKAVAELWLTLIVDEIWEQCAEHFDFWDDLTSERQDVLIDMAYNLGWNGLLQFKNMLKHVENAEYIEAGKHILASKAARQHESWGNPRYKVLAAKMKG